MIPRKDILIIGGGVIGVCAAYYLSKKGREVMLLESGNICSGASYGNAGFILYSHIIPLAAPGVLGQGMKWLLDATSPFYIKPRFSKALAMWLWRFYRACNEKDMRRSMGLLFDISRESRRLFGELSGLKELDFGYRQAGHLRLYHTENGFENAKQEAELMGRYGVDIRALDTPQVYEMEPAVSPDIVGGLYFPKDAHVIPDKLVSGLATIAQDLGAEIRTGTEVMGFDADGSNITGVRTTRGNFSAKEIVLTGGAWSPVIARDLNLSLPIQGAKGYSVTYALTDDPSVSVPSIPLLLKEAAVAVTPMPGMMRFSGTLELAGLDMSINEKRIAAFLRNAERYVSIPRNLNLLEIWRGLRPCTPDGLPMIGRSKRYRNLILATGHATIGMELGPVTGELVARIAENETPGFDISLLSPDRF